MALTKWYYFWNYTEVNAAPRKALEAIFTDPVPKNLEWRRLERLLIAVGCEVKEGKGSRVSFSYKERSIHFHRPHPEKKPGRIRYGMPGRFWRP